MDRLSLPVNGEIVPIKTLLKLCDEYAKNALSKATKRAYQTDWKMFFDFCKSHDLEPLPADPETVCLFLTDEAAKKRSVATIRRRITSLKAIHVASQHPNPIKNEKVERVLKGIVRACGEPQRKAKAISWKEIQAMVAQCDSMMIGLRDSALLSLGWASALRRSELVALNIGDLDFSEYGMIVTVKRSKTDWQGQGAKIGIPHAKTGFCPVATVKRWLERRSRDPLPPLTPLFPTIGTGGRGKWWWEPRGRMSARMVTEIVKQHARYIGLCPSFYSAHSLRRGLATEAGSLGVEERFISRHTRHRSMEVLRGYIEDGTIWAENPLSAVYPSLTPLPGR